MKNPADMTDRELSALILKCAFRVHTVLGPGLREQMYRKALAYEMRKYDLLVEEEVMIPAMYEEIYLANALYIDIWVERRYVLELKVKEHIVEAHVAQALTYMKFSKTKHGLIINFMEARLAPNGIKRLIYDPEYMRQNYRSRFRS